jgi:hypothetical protein
VADFVESSLIAPRSEIHRLGNAIVSIRDDQSQVLGLLHEHSAKLESIDSAIGGLTVSQVAIGHSLTVLQNLSMLTLGMSAFSYLILFRQFQALRIQVTQLEQKTHRLGAMVEAQQLGQLETGLTQLRDGIDDIKAGRTEQGKALINPTAANNLRLNVNVHAILLSRELKLRRPDRILIRELFRHLAVGLMGEAGCHLALGNNGRAREVIQGRMGLIEEYVKVVFRQTIGDNPVRFLCPGMAKRGITMDFLVELIRQAALAKAVDRTSNISAVDLIEDWRSHLHTSRDPFWSSTLDDWYAELTEALSAVEEVNRLKGFSLSLTGIDSGHVTYDDALAGIQQEMINYAMTEGFGFAYFPP